MEKLGLAALVTLVTAEAFAFSLAVFWAIAQFAHLGLVGSEVALGFSVVAGLGCGAAMMTVARRHLGDL
ncbi:MAG: hypothetical protein R3C58_13450 [Parvularculaceae bacterium]